MGWQREQYERLHGLGGELDAAFLNACVRESRPWCDSGRVVMFGSGRRGVRRGRCGTCGRTFTPATGMMFGDRKLPVIAWFEFLFGITSYKSLAGMARRGRKSPTTPPYQLAKLFMVLEAYRTASCCPGASRPTR